MLIQIIFLIILLFVAVALLIAGVRIPKKGEIIDQRLQNISGIENIENLSEIELAQSFSTRVVNPLLNSFAQLGNRIIPKNPLNQVTKKLELAGKTGQIQPSVIIIGQFIAGIFLSGIVLILFIVLNPDWINLINILIIIGAGLFGYIYPQLWLQGLISKRQKSIRLSMPDVLDLLTICVEAGLGFDAAMSKVADKWDNDISGVFARIIKEIQLGKVRREALKDMSERVNIPEMTSFVAAIIQSEQLGVSISKVLRIQSDQMRMRRRQRAEEEAHKVPTKMLLPMAALIFPCIVIIIMTPIIFKLMNSALANMF